METMSINWTAIAAIVVAGALLMVPVLGLTLRLVIPPVIEALARSRQPAAALTAGRPAAPELTPREVVALQR
jgi:hypothetical protein